MTDPVPGTVGRPERRIAAVTGASSAIGAAIALVLADMGHDLALMGRNAARLDEVALECRRVGVQAATCPFDLAGPNAMATAVVRVRADMGEPRVLVHCAGVFDWARIDEADTETWAELMEINVTAAMRLTRLLVPSLRSYPGSAVIFIGSGAAYQGFANNAAYVASKHAVLGFGQALFQDLRDQGVKVSVISPGLVAAGASLTLDSGLHDRFLRPADVAEAVRYVLSSSRTACPTEIRLEPQRTPL